MTTNIFPQRGAQTLALASPANVLVYGGAAGSGKSFGLLMDAARDIDTPGYSATIFRRTYKQFTQDGGLWPVSKTFYQGMKGIGIEGKLRWTFPSGATISFSYLDGNNLSRRQGAQIAMIGIDEITEFSEEEFWFLLSRNRTTCGVEPRFRATCNPDAEHWLAKFLAWWIDQDSGYPIADRSGRLRWFVRYEEKIEWANRRETLLARYPELLPISVTFIPAKLDDNRILDESDPSYRAKLMGLNRVERMRFLEGNWKIRPSAGEMFPHSHWKMIPRDVFMAKAHTMRFCRSWDKAGTEGGKGARTAGVLLAGPKTSHQGPFFIVNAKAGRWGDEQREAEIKVTADIDAIEYGSVNVLLEKEPGSGGKHSARMTIRNLAGHAVTAEVPSGPKVSRWRALSSQQRAGNVFIVEGNWDIPGFISELDALSGDEKIDKPRLKDLADAAGAGFNHLTSMYGRGVIEGPLLADEGDTDYDDWSPKEKAAMPEFLRDICDSVGSNDDPWKDYQ